MKALEIFSATVRPAAVRPLSASSSSTLPRNKLETYNELITCFHEFCNYESIKVPFLLILKALVVKNSVLRDFGFGKVSHIHKTFLMELQLFGWRHYSKTEVVQNTVLNH